MSTAIDDFSSEFARVHRTMGDELLRYVLSLSDGDELGVAGLTSGQRDVVRILASRTRVDGLGEAAALDGLTRLSDLTNPVPLAGMSLVNLLRSTSGGHVEDPQATGDQLADAIALIARDVWPIYLARPATQQGPRTFWLSTPIGAFNHPAFPAAIDAFVSDPRLMKLFPHPPTSEEEDLNWVKVPGHMSLIVTSSGRGGSLQLSALVPNVLATSIFRCLMTGSRLSLKTLMPHITTAVADLRRLADGETVMIPAIIGFSGVTVATADALEVTEGRLRPASEADRELFLAGAPALTTVFETSYPMRVLSVTEHDLEGSDGPLSTFSKYQDRIAASRRSFDHAIDLTRLSMLLASTSQAPWLAREVARYISDPLSHGGASSWDPSYTSVANHELAADDFGKVREWHSRVQREHVPSLDIGMRRLLSASTMRNDPIDAFVDAVVCWENMFGVQTETTFRVTASIAKLLAPADSRAREALQKELKTLYSIRSRLVHGGSEPKPEEITEFREKAIRFATDCFRVLYKDRPDLLELGSDARGARILLE